jgi:hypothetical protein
VEETVDDPFSSRITRWIWVPPVVVAAVFAVPLSDSLASWATTWLYLFLPQFLVLGVVTAENISAPSLVAAGIASVLLAAILCWLAAQLGPWMALVYLCVMPAVFGGAWAAVWIDRRASATRDVPRAIACGSSILLVAGFGYLMCWWQLG